MQKVIVLTKRYAFLSFVDVEAKFCCDDSLVASAFESMCQNSFTVTRAIVCCSVEEIDAEIKRSVDGADGFIVPDLPMEESDELMSVVGADSRPPLPLIPMLTPTTPSERMEMIARNAKGFVYLVSVTGVTGERKSISEGLGELISRVREHTDVPVCVGFGISTPEQAAQVGALADGVIVGSACVKAIGGSEKPIETAKQFAAGFRSALSASNA